MLGRERERLQLARERCSEEHIINNSAQILLNVGLTRTRVPTATPEDDRGEKAEPRRYALLTLIRHPTHTNPADAAGARVRRDTALIATRKPSETASISNQLSELMLGTLQLFRGAGLELHLELWEIHLVERPWAKATIACRCCVGAESWPFSTSSAAPATIFGSAAMF